MDLTDEQWTQFRVAMDDKTACPAWKDGAHCYSWGLRAATVAVKRCLCGAFVDGTPPAEEAKP